MKQNLFLNNQNRDKTINNSNQAGKFIVFNIADYFLAVPISVVLKVVNYPHINNNSNTTKKTTELVQIGSHTIALLDLHQKLPSNDTPDVNIHTPFLLIAQLYQGLCAIPLESPPNLVELSRDSIQALPNSFAHNDLLKAVSYGAVISDQENTFTIFILDINQAWYADRNTNLIDNS